MHNTLPSFTAAHATGMRDVTSAWRRSHAHLMPLDTARQAGDQNGYVQVQAHVRLGDSDWVEMVPLQFERATGRVLLAERDLIAALGERTNLSEKTVELVNARLWTRSPTVINIEPTTRCNFNCWYCVGRHMKQEDIRVEDFARMLDNFPDLKTIALVGEGEPLMHKDFFNMANMARERGIRVMIISNGSAFSQSVVRQLCESEVAYVSISIDSFDPATFATSRIDGDLDRVLKGIRQLRDYRDSNGFTYPKIALKGTLFSHTKDQLPAIVDVAKAAGVEIFESFQALNPMTSYIRIYPQGQLPEVAPIAEVADAILRDSRYGREQLQPMEDFLRESKIDLSQPMRPNTLQKNCDEVWMYSLLSGDITPCCQIKTPVSPNWNIFNHTVEDILADEEYENVRFNLWNGIFPAYCEGCWKTRV